MPRPRKMLLSPRPHCPCVTIMTMSDRNRSLHRAGLVMFLAGLVGLTIRMVLMVFHPPSHASDVILLLGAALFVIAGVLTMRAKPPEP